MNQLKDYARYRNNSIIVCIIIIIIFFMFFRSNLQETTYVTIGEDSLGIQSYKGQEISVS
jgi:hypothetical protein